MSTTPDLEAKGYNNYGAYQHKKYNGQGVYKVIEGNLPYGFRLYRRK